MKRTLALGATSALLLLSAACGRETTTADVAADCTPAWQFDTVTEGTLTVATIQQLPGANVAPDGTVTGIDSELLGDFAAEACLELNWQPLAGPAAVAAMTEGQADVGGGGWYRTAARAEIVGQTDPVWYDTVGIVSPDGLSSIEDLQGRTVGVVGGSLFEAPLKAAIGDANVVVLQNLDAVFQELDAGRIDAGMGGGGNLTVQVAERNSDLQVEGVSPDSAYPELTAPGEPNYPYTKTNTALGEALDDFIATAREDGRIRQALEDQGLTDPSYVTGPAN